MFGQERGASWLSFLKPRKSEIDIHVPGLILEAVGRGRKGSLFSEVSLEADCSDLPSEI